MSISDCAIILATLLGPVLAVQAQKWIERSKKRIEQKEWIFHTLMTNRRDRFSQRTISALNSIDLAFGGGLPKDRQSKKDHAVTEKWQQMLVHLDPAHRLKENDPRLPGWIQKSDDLYFDLLDCMSKALGYGFDISELKRGGYLPEGQIAAELEGQAVRRALLSFLEGGSIVNVNVTRRDQQSGPAPLVHQ